MSHHHLGWLNSIQKNRFRVSRQQEVVLRLWLINMKSGLTSKDFCGRVYIAVCPVNSVQSETAQSRSLFLRWVPCQNQCVSPYFRASAMLAIDLRCPMRCPFFSTSLDDTVRVLFVVFQFFSLSAPKLCLRSRRQVMNWCCARICLASEWARVFSCQSHFVFYVCISPSQQFLVSESGCV